MSIETKNSDTSARLAAIKDIPTQRLIELAVAEAAGLISILPSAAERAHQDAQPNEPLTLEELREMDGQPAWCKELGVWGIISVAQSGPRAFKPYFSNKANDTFWYAHDIEMLDMTLYRSPPKEA